MKGNYIAPLFLLCAPGGAPPWGMPPLGHRLPSALPFIATLALSSIDVHWHPLSLALPSALPSVGIYWNPYPIAKMHWKDRKGLNERMPKKHLSAQGCHFHLNNPGCLVHQHRIRTCRRRFARDKRIHSCCTRGPIGPIGAKTNQHIALEIRTTECALIIYIYTYICILPM